MSGSPDTGGDGRAGLADLDLTDDEAAYVRLHGPRYEVLIEAMRVCVDALGERGPAATILDVGPAAQTELIRRAFPSATVDTLGYANRISPARDGERHFELDLNDAAAPGRRPEVPPHDLVVAAEVIEHLTAPPRAVFELFADWLEPGGRLVIQTPNALALHKRVRTLAGRNPLGAAGDVGAGSHSAAHFREYTLAELRQVALAAGLEPVRAVTGNHFRGAGTARRAYDRLTARLPAGTRQGITAYFRKR